MRKRTIGILLGMAMLAFASGRVSTAIDSVYAAEESDTSDDEEDEDEEEEDDSYTKELEQKRNNALDQIKSLKSDISTVESKIKELKNSKSNLQSYINQHRRIPIFIQIADPRFHHLILILRIRFCFFQLFCTSCYIIFRSCYIIFQLFDLGRKSIHLPVKLIDI